MGKHGINVPKGVAVGSVDELRKALREVFPNESEVVTRIFLRSLIHWECNSD